MTRKSRARIPRPYNLSDQIFPITADYMEKQAQLHRRRIIGGCISYIFSVLFMLLLIPVMASFTYWFSRSMYEWDWLGWLPWS